MTQEGYDVRNAHVFGKECIDLVWILDKLW